MMYTGVAGTYLTQFYTDVLGVAGAFLTMMPLVSKILTGIISIFIGRFIDRTHTVQGKARPWILGSGILLAVCGIALYAVPKASYEMQIVWIVISYNLFFSLAYSTYSLSHSLMVPLSTRDTKQRDSLAMLTSTGTAMIPGMLVTIIMPLLVKSIGVGSGAQGMWITVMGILSVIALPGTLMEYYFTKERVTSQLSAEKVSEASFGKQVSACFRDKYWLMAIAFMLICHLCSALTSNSMLYYCNWVLGNSIDSGATKQILVNAIGQAPMGFGVVILWPLVRRFGKRKVSVIGFSIAALGTLAVLIAKDNLVVVLTALFIKSIGALPTYVMSAVLAEALDHVEQQSGFRADGFSASVNSIILTVVQGIGQTVLLAGIGAFGYITPESTAQIITQPDAVRGFFSWCFAGLPMIGYAICAMIMLFYNIESRNAKGGS
jgi:GPH family glycoside/pentoside/hexuronide:cation symporter